jgi:trans-aconitate methyltransferase
MKEWNADYYDKNSIMQYSTAMILINEIQLNGDENVLDIGSGSGKITYEFAKRLPHGHITGIDISKEMVSFA